MDGELGWYVRVEKGAFVVISQEARKRKGEERNWAIWKIESEIEIIH